MAAELDLCWKRTQSWMNPKKKKKATGSQLFHLWGDIQALPKSLAESKP